MNMEDDESSESSVVNIDPLVDFWGVELSAKQRKSQWPVEEVEPDVEQRLELRQACLGAKAKSGERNVVELTAEDENGEEVTHTILSLTVGGLEQSPLFLEVFPPVVFNLAAGSGPVHIVGSSYTEIDKDYISEDEDDTNHFQLQNRKRTANSPPIKPAKTRKLDSATENGNSTDIKFEDNEEEESDEEDDSEESDDEDDEEEEEEDDEEEIEITPQKPMAVNKPKAKSAQKPSKSTVLKQLSRTPQPLKGSKTSGKITLSAPNTPEQRKISKRGGTKTTAMSVEDMKEKLKKTPNLPRKLDKFSNYVQHNFKVNDDKVKKQLWEYAQKMKAVKQ